MQPALLDGESPDQGKKRLARMIDDSAITAITLQMRKPKSVALVWQEKESLHTL